MMFIYMYIMHILTVDASRVQGRKLAKGHPVRIKQGTGFNLIVHPTTYRLATRAFAKGKAVQIKLSPEELDLNRQAHENPEMMNDHTELHGEIVGQGMFSWLTKPFKKAGRWLKGAANTTGKFFKKTGNKIADFATNKSTLRALKGIGKFAARQGANALGDVVGVIPGVGGIARKGVQNLGVVASKAIDDPSSVGGWEGAGKTILTGQGMRGCGGDLYGMVAKGHMRQRVIKNRQAHPLDLSKGMGLHGYEALRAANRGLASASAANAQYTSQGIKSRKPITPSWHDDPFAPRSRGMGVAIVGHGGGMLQHTQYVPPALISQPFSANYQMSHFLPVPYQHFNRSMDVDGYSSEEEEMQGRGMRHCGRGFGLYV